MTANPVTDAASPPVVDRQTWLRARDELLAREKAHTREGDAIAAARRRLPMTLVPPVAVQGPGGRTPLVDVFEGRSLLIAYFHMWHDGAPFEGQCEGCTFSTCHVQLLDYLHARDVTYAVFCQGPYPDSAAFARFMGYPFPWYSARDAEPALVDGRDFGFIACYLRDGDQVYETYWTTGRGVEALMTSYHALDLTVYGRQEAWEDSPAGWPRVNGHPWRLDGRPTAQWSRLPQD
ncbi:DUF899 family protein [Catellatospora citrea]|uniref:Dithiol-disulfide oxidoreductase (DUF899 family) n=1 Tax=Catellatospora citrea TaxID=53366 RepID=A0A8J3KMR0_9ACTN|nr:DUF899 family protein [Catellatospora citrea]RKE00434.1 putative dithiol-disulfide oxidoreductase (DUF899 family) [Catellatospora citrea]GIF98094.1 hypothetical protein Cci01nite_31880 [Catellatospora citrea]